MVCVNSGVCIHPIAIGREQAGAPTGTSALCILWHQPGHRTVAGAGQSLSLNLHWGRATRCRSQLWHPFISLFLGHNDSEFLPRDTSGQPRRLNTSHQTEVQSLEIGTMAKRLTHYREKTLLRSVVGENLQRQQTGQWEEKEKVYIWLQEGNWTQCIKLEWAGGWSTRQKKFCYVKITIKTVTWGNFLHFSNAY